MTFQEYIHQVNPKRNLPVEIRESDCHTFIPHPNTHINIRAYITLVIDGDFFTYAVKRDGDTLFTTDDDGNPLKRSCFTWITQS